MLSKNWRKEWTAIPNLLSFLRLLLLPLYLWLFFSPQQPRGMIAAGVVMLISGLTDFFDGLIARHFDQITELGILLDPVADKLTQLVLIASLVYLRPEIWPLILLFAAKELFMAVAGYKSLRAGVKLKGAKWYGKVSTAVFYLGMVLVLLFPQLPVAIENVIFWLIGAALLQSFVLYALEYRRLFRAAFGK